MSEVQINQARTFIDTCKNFTNPVNPAKSREIAKKIQNNGMLERIVQTDVSPAVDPFYFLRVDKTLSNESIRVAENLLIAAIRVEQNITEEERQYLSDLVRFASKHALSQDTRDRLIESQKASERQEGENKRIHLCIQRINSFHHRVLTLTRDNEGRTIAFDVNTIASIRRLLNLSDEATLNDCIMTYNQLALDLKEPEVVANPEIENWLAECLAALTALNNR